MKPCRWDDVRGRRSRSFGLDRIPYLLVMISLRLLGLVSFIAHFVSGLVDSSTSTFMLRRGGCIRIYPFYNLAVADAQESKHLHLLCEQALARVQYSFSRVNSLRRSWALCSNCKRRVVQQQFFYSDESHSLCETDLRSAPRRCRWKRPAALISRQCLGLCLLTVPSDTPMTKSLTQESSK